MSDDGEPAPTWLGVMWIGGDLRITPNLTLTADGNLSGTPDVEVRTDMWPFWLEEAIEAAEAVCRITEPLPDIAAAFQEAERRGNPDESTNAALKSVLYRELPASMRAIASCAFAFDAFYATVKERCGPHPHAAIWREKRTGRDKQILETLRHHFKLDGSQTTKLIAHLDDLFARRDMAVHMAANYHDPLPRRDIRVSMDERFNKFRRDTAVAIVANTVVIFDYFVSVLSLNPWISDFVWSLTWLS